MKDGMKNSDTDPISSKEWQKHRKMTTIAFTIQQVLLGAEYSITFLTLWLYLKTLVKVENPKLMYGIISASYLLSATAASLVVGRFVDHTRNVRCTFFIVNTLVIVGNIIYSLPFSIVLLIAGRILAGIAGSLRPVANGELVRCYESHELSKRISLMGMMYSIGFIMGPAVNFFFKTVKTNIGTWVIDYTNSPTLFLAVMFAVMQVITYFMVYDIWKQFDLKNNYKASNNNRKTPSKTISNGSKASCNDFIHLKMFDIKSIKMEKNRQLISENIDENLLLIQKEATSLTGRKSAAFVLWSLLRTFDTSVIVITAWFVTFFMTCCEIWLTLAVLEALQWSVTELTATIFLIGVTCTLMCLFFILKELPHKVNYIIHLVSLWSFTFAGVWFMLLKCYSFSTWFRVFMLTTYAVIFTMQVYIQDIYLVATLAKLVPSDIQSFADGIRLGSSRMGALFALLFSALLFNYIFPMVICFAVFTDTAFMIYFYRRKILANPVVIVKI